MFLTPLPNTLLHHLVCLQLGYGVSSTSFTAEWSVKATTSCPYRYLWKWLTAHTIARVSQLCVYCFSLGEEGKRAACIIHWVGLLITLHLWQCYSKPLHTDIRLMKLLSKSGYARSMNRPCQFALQFFKAFWQDCIHSNSAPFCVRAWSGWPISAKPCINAVVRCYPKELPYFSHTLKNKELLHSLHMIWVWWMPWQGYLLAGLIVAILNTPD